MKKYNNFILNKQINILITNVCNLSCGGCSQHCGYIQKEKLWNISIDQLKWNIELLIDCKGKIEKIGIFGGEPTIHPEYEKILEMLKNFKEIKFQIFTNGIKKYQDKWNHYYSPVYKDKNSEKVFTPTSVAPMDILKVDDKTFYWEKAQKDCFMYNFCCSIIYNNKAYFCEPAAAWDIMTGENNGWDLKWGEDPFKRTDDEIEKQALNFCYRCGWCFNKDDLRKYKIPNQLVKDSTIVTQINLPIGNNKNKNRIDYKKY